MNLLNAVLGERDGQMIDGLARQFGLSTDQTTSAIGAMLPALAAGLQRNTGRPGGLEALLGALAAGGHGRYLDDADLLGRSETTREGNAILGHILGSKDVSRSVASNAASATGVSQDVLKRMLPILATLAMGALARQTASTGAAPASQASMTENLGSLASFLDLNRDGSVADDVAGFVGRLFGSR